MTSDLVPEPDPQHIEPTSADAVAPAAGGDGPAVAADRALTTDGAPGAPIVPGSPPAPERRWLRRTFVVRALGGVGAALAAVVAVPVAGLASAPVGGPLRFPLTAGAIPPTLRTTGFTSLGPLESFPVGQPTLVPATVPVTIAGVQQDAQIAVYVVRPHDQSVLIMDIHCTHMGCPISWSQGAKQFLCPCHGGAFAQDGTRVSGPPPRSLDRYQAVIANQEVWMGPLVEES